MTRIMCSVIATLFIFPLFLQSQDLIMNVYNRETTSLDGYWKYIIDPYENGYYNYRYQAFDKQTNPSKNAFFKNAKQSEPSELLEYNFDLCDSIQVPGDWNSQKEALLYYEGTVWYKKSFDYQLAEGKRLFVYFGAANYKAEIYFNGHKLGTHIGGFTPFNYEITELVNEGENFIVVKVDNKRQKDGIPTLNTDWWNYGGLTRSVKLVETPETFIQDYFIQLNPDDSNAITASISLNGAMITDQSIELKIPELNLSTILKTDSTGNASFEFQSNKIKYWFPQKPKLYDLTISTGADNISDQIGFRTIKTAGADILLNGEPIFLKGISIHEENPIRGGRAYSQQDAKQLLDWAQELGCNFVRLAHYPHNEHMVRLADKMGILVWEENPVYWTISWDNADTYDNAQNQLSELIARDKNRASVIIWSMANETPTSKSRNIFLNKLAQHARSLDQTRLLSAALEQKNYKDNPFVRTIDDPFAEVVDVLSFNEYIGWYDGLPDKCEKISWHIEQNKPVLISEFGGGAKQGLHGRKEERWTEEFQEELYIQSLEMLSQVEQLRGMSPWILVDFRSPRRPLPVIQDGWNRKGLLSDDGKKKKAFFILQEYYSEK